MASPLARHLHISDILALQPGDRIVAHPITEELIVTRDGTDVSPTALNVAHQSFAPRGTLRAENLEKILDCLLETRIVVRSEDDKVLQVLELNARNWREIIASPEKRLEQEGSTATESESPLNAHVDLMVGGLRIAKGEVVREEGGGALLITELVGRNREKLAGRGLPLV